METTTISYSPSVFATTNLTVRPLHEIIAEIKSNKWKEIISSIRVSKNKEEKKKIKTKYLPIFLPGTYHNDIRKANKLINSCLLIFDADNLAQDKLLELTNRLKSDKSVFCFFISPSGNGLKIICKLDKDISNHNTYSNIYLYYKDVYEKKYCVILDNVQDASRSCFLSYDPDLFFREGEIDLLPTEIVMATAIIPTKEKRAINLLDRRVESVIEFLEGRIPSYDIWLKFCFACASLGEDGRPIFQKLSKGNPNYSDTEENIDKQFDICLKNYDSNKTKFSHIFTYAKALGWKHEKENPIEVIQNFLATRNLIRNTVTRRILDNDCNREIDTNFINTMYSELKLQNQNFNYQDFERVINSQFINDFNPIKDFFERNAGLEVSGNIDKLVVAMRPENQEYAKCFITKWLVSVVASVYGNISPLVLVLVGDKQNTGKTEFFRRLFPKELSLYYGESKLDNGKDDYILMCEKLIIMDDEFGGKSKMENKLLKELTSKHIFNLREPYGRHNVNLPRLAVLCGTSNEYSILTDPSGNRRIIPIYIENEMDFDCYNSINKKELWIEIFNLYKSSYAYELNRNDINALEELTTRYVAINPERELIQQYIFMPQPGDIYREMTATEIKMHLEDESHQRININKLGAELQYMKFNRIRKKINGKNSQLYQVVLKGLKNVI